MKQSTVPKHDVTRNDGQLEHLAQVRALTQAIASAISAIEKHDLRQFETHLAVQETICNRLSAVSATLSLMTSGIATMTEAEAKTAAGEDSDVALRQEILEAHIALAQLNRVYAALLKRARKTVGLIASLYQGHGQGYNRESSALLQRHSWSCEV